MFNNSQQIKIGFVPSYRGEWGSIPLWCVQMRKEALAVLNKIVGIEVVVPQPCVEDNQVVDPVIGYSPDGAVGNLDQGDAVAEFFPARR